MKTVVIAIAFSIFLPISAFASEPENIIFDTDTAYFADDGVALVMLLQKPEQISIRGMTIVAGNHFPRQGVEYMLHVLDLMKRQDIPVYLGADSPLRNNADMSVKMTKEWGLNFKGAFGRKQINAPSDIDPPSGGKFSQHRPEKSGAVTYLVETLEHTKSPITIVALGPLTNIAKLLQKRPSLAKKIRRLVLFGGNVHAPGNTTPYAEFNFWFDPEATDFVLKSSIKDKIMIGLDLSNQAIFSKAQFDQIISAQSPVTELFKEDRGTRGPKFLSNPAATTFVWDALVAGYLIDPSIVTNSEKQYLNVITEFGPKYGAVEISRVKKGTPVTVMTGLNYDKFFQLFKTLLTKPVQ